jgi:hypothetical protein
MKAENNTRMPWQIVEAPHGVFLEHKNYCVVRLDDKSPQQLYATIASHDALVAALEAAEQCIGELSPTQARVEAMQMIQAALSQSRGEKP